MSSTINRLAMATENVDHDGVLRQVAEGTGAAWNAPADTLRGAVRAVGTI